MHLLPQSWVRATVLIIAALLAFAGVAVMTFVSPTYEAAVRIKVEKELSDDVQSMAGQGAAFDPYWVQDQFEALQSKAVLYQVITNLDLTQRWGNLSLDQAFVRLRYSLDVRQYRGTSLIEIRYWSKDRHETANVVNAIASTFRDYRLEQLRDKQIAGIRVLEKQLREQDAKIAKGEHQSDAESLKQVRERLLTRLQEAKTAPVKSSVQLIEIASPPSRPIRNPPMIGLMTGPQEVDRYQS